MSSQTVFINKAATDQSLDIGPILDSTDGTVLTGLVYNTASLACYYRRGATGTLTALTLATQTVGGAHTDGGFVEISATNADGMYRLDFSDAILATGEDRAMVILQGAANMQPHTIHIVLTDEIVTGSDNKVEVSADAHTAGVTVADVTASVSVDTLTASALADLFNTDSGTTAASAISGSVVSELATRVLDNVIETQGSYTLQQAISIILAVNAGVTSASGATIATPNGVSTRVAATINGSNERTGMTLTPST